jgi:membrane associated rhomboid family serine protease
MIPYAIENHAPKRHGLIGALVAANVVGLVLEIAFFPNSLSYAFTPLDRRPVTFITSQFMHAGFGHLFGNMYALLLFGPGIAHRVGRWFIPFYLTGGLAAALLHAAVDPFSSVPCLGASGAVAACMGAYVVLFQNARMKFFSKGVFLNLSPLVFALIWLAAEGMGAFGDGGGIAHWAHLGGFAFGAAAATAMPGDGESETSREINVERAAAVHACLAMGDDAGAAANYATAAAERADFELAGDKEQLAAGKALFRAGGAHLAEAALDRLVRRSPDAPESAEALLILGDLELGCFKEFAAALARYGAVAAHPEASPELRRDASEGAAQARKALSADTPAGTAGTCSILFEGEPPMTPEQLGVVCAASATSPGPMTGILICGLDAAAATPLAAALESKGVPAVVAPESGFLRLAPGGQVEEASFADDGVHAGGRHHFGYSDILLAAVVWVIEIAYQHDPFDIGVSVVGIGGVHDVAAEKVAVRQLSPRLEIIARDGRRVRIDPHGEGLGVLRAAAHQISVRAPSAHLDWSARAVLGGREPLWAHFHSPEEADVYLHWQLQLARLKSLSSYGRSSARA